MQNELHKEHNSIFNVIISQVYYFLLKKNQTIRAVILVINLFIGLKDYTSYVKEHTFGSEITYRRKA